MAASPWWVTAHAAAQLVSRLRLGVLPDAAGEDQLAALDSAEKLPRLSNDGAEQWRVRVLGGEVVALAHRGDRRRVVVTVVTLGMAGLAPEPAADDLLAPLLASLPEGCR